MNEPLARRPPLVVALDGLHDRSRKPLSASPGELQGDPPLRGQEASTTGSGLSTRILKRRAAPMTNRREAGSASRRTLRRQEERMWRSVHGTRSNNLSGDVNRNGT